jgi:hypothetical protein
MKPYNNEEKTMDLAFKFTEEYETILCQLVKRWHSDKPLDSWYEWVTIEYV